jgi:hypothetical protein
MLETSQATVAGKTASGAPAARHAAKPARDTQASGNQGFGSESRGGWTVAQRAARPVNLERRARFAGFDVL